MHPFLNLLVDPVQGEVAGDAQGVLLVGAMLRELGARPKRGREAIFYYIGKVIAGICHVGGWFIPMSGVGKLEAAHL